jgi:microfibrillar-associated protein 1
MSAAVRKPATRLAKPAAVYRRGQAPKGVSAAADLSESDFDEDEGVAGAEEAGDEEVRDMPLRTVDVEDDDEDENDETGRTGALPSRYAASKMNIALRDVKIKEGKVIVAGREESGRTAMEGEWCLYFI